MSIKIIKKDCLKKKIDARLVIINSKNEPPCIQKQETENLNKDLDVKLSVIKNKDKIFRKDCKYYIEAKFIDENQLTKFTQEDIHIFYREALKILYQNQLSSLLLPQIKWGDKWSREEILSIAIEEIKDFSQEKTIDIFLEVEQSSGNISDKELKTSLCKYVKNNFQENDIFIEKNCLKNKKNKLKNAQAFIAEKCLESTSLQMPCTEAKCSELCEEEFEEVHESKLKDRINHLADTFSEYLIYLIKEKQLDNATVYKRALVDKKVFSKIKNNKDYHPQKLTALCLCVGLELNLDETKDLLARAGYALSPCDKTDVIFSYFIENKIYDMIELDIQLEEYGLQCIIA